MYRNYTRQDQVFSHGTLPTVTVHPGFLVDERVHPDVIKYKHAFAPFYSVADFFEESKDKDTHVVFTRMFALGDVIMLHAICLRLLQRFPKLRITVLTSDRFVKLFDYTDKSRLSVKEYKGLWIGGGVDLGVNLDGCLEVDHTNLPVYKKHRVHLYVEALGYR